MDFKMLIHLCAKLYIKLLIMFVLHAHVPGHLYRELLLVPGCEQALPIQQHGLGVGTCRDNVVFDLHAGAARGPGGQGQGQARGCMCKHVCWHFGG